MQHYHLGSLLLAPDLSALLDESLAGGRRRSPGAIVELIRRYLGDDRAARPLPDLLAALREDRGPDAWVFELAAALAEYRGLRLTHCERAPGPGGYLAIAVHDRSQSKEIRTGDLLCAGLAAVRTPAGEVEVMPRIYRKVCANGAIVLDHTGEDVLHQVGKAFGIRAAVDACLAPATAAASFARLQLAAQRTAGDPIALLRRARVAEPEQVWAGREEQDDSVFGVVNALTARARREPRLDRRLELERGAARILAAAGAGVGREVLAGSAP